MTTTNFIEKKIAEFKHLCLTKFADWTGIDSARKEKWLTTTLQEAITEGRALERKKLETLRPQFEKLLWKEYDPHIAPNMEELLDKIYALITNPTTEV